MIGGVGTQGLGITQDLNRGRRVGGPEPGGHSARQWRRWIVRDGQMIRKPGSDVVDGKCQAATGTGRREPGSAKAEFVGDVADEMVDWMIDGESRNLQHEERIMT